MYRPEWRGGGALWDLIRRAVCAVLSRRGCLLSSIYPAVGGKAATETSATGESSYRNECATGESSYRKACCRASLAIDCCHAEHTRSGDLDFGELLPDFFNDNVITECKRHTFTAMPDDPQS